MEFRVQIYCEADGVPSPTDPQSIAADTAKAAAEQLTGGKILEAGLNGKLAAMVWRAADPSPKKVAFYRP